MYKKFKYQQLLYLSPSILLLLAVIWKSDTFIIHDFANYYYGAYSIVEGLFQPDIYDALHFNQLLRSEGFDNLFVSYYPNTPFLAFAFIPLQLFSWQDAKLLFNIVGSFLFLYSLYRSFKFYRIPFYYLLLIPILFYTPIKNNILFGQPYFYLFFLLIEGLLCYEKKSMIWTALLWGLAILLKVFPVLLFIWLLLKKDWKGFLYLGVACAVLLFVSLPFCGISSWQYFITDIFPKSSAGIIFNSFTPKANSAIMLFRNIFVYDAMFNPEPLINSTFLYNLVSTGYKIIILSICTFASLSQKNNTLISFSFWMLASLLISPTNSSYANLFLIFPFISILTSINNTPKLYLVIGTVFIVLICNLPLQHFYDLPILLKFPKLYISILFFGLLAFIFHLNIHWRILISFSTLFGAMALLGNSLKTAPSYVQTGEKYPAIMAGFGEKEGKLYYRYWHVGGETEKQTNLSIDRIDEKDIFVKKHQIYYKNKKITNSPDRKQHPRLVGNNEIYYLSDMNRGTGFYTLRKIPIVE